MAAASFEPTLNLNASTIRAPYSTSAAPSMADTLPPLNFGFDDLRQCMNNFTRRFDEFIETGRKRVLDERNQFRMHVASIKEDHRTAVRATSSLSQKSTAHASTLASHSAETNEMREAISALTNQRDAHAANVATLRTRLASTKSTIATKKAAQRQHQQYMAHQASFNQPEIEAWEHALGLRIEGTGRDDIVRFVFVGLEKKQRPHQQIDEDDLGREAYFELDMRGLKGRGYEVAECRPRVDAKELERSVMSMCEKEELGVFLKDMRALFVRSMQ